MTKVALFLAVSLPFAACSTDGVDVDRRFFGLFHEVGAVDASNIEIRDDGTYSRAENGCDFFFEDRGTWSADTEINLILVSDLDSSARDEIEITASGFQMRRILDLARGQGRFEEDYALGGVCAVCGGDLGPTGQEPCSDPPMTVQNAGL